MNLLPDPTRALVAGIPGVEQAARVRQGMAILATAPRPPVAETPQIGRAHV